MRCTVRERQAGCNYDGSTMEFDHLSVGRRQGTSGTCYTSNVLASKAESEKSSEKFPALFAPGAATKSSGHGVDYKDNKYIAIMNKCSEHTWGYDQAAFNGTKVADMLICRLVATSGKKLSKKEFLNIFPYVIWEMQAVVYNNDDQSHAWDEAVAFYAGSTVGGDHGTLENCTSFQGVLR